MGPIDIKLRSLGLELLLCHAASAENEPLNGRREWREEKELAGKREKTGMRMEAVGRP